MASNTVNTHLIISFDDFLLRDYALTGILHCPCSSCVQQKYLGDLQVPRPVSRILDYPSSDVQQTKNPISLFWNLWEISLVVPRMQPSTFKACHCFLAQCYFHASKDSFLQPCPRFHCTVKSNEHLTMYMQSV